MFFKIIFFGLLLILMGGLGYFAITDVKIDQTERVDTLPAEKFLK